MEGGDGWMDGWMREGCVGQCMLSLSRAENYEMPRAASRCPGNVGGSSFMFHALLPTVTVLRRRDGERE